MTLNDAAGYREIQAGHETERLLKTGRIVPARITLALDSRMLEGPDVDIACGAEEPDVDRWEAGLAVPTAEQVVKLAALTRYPVAWFYRPVQPGPLLGGPVFVCSRGHGGCQQVQPHVIDENGVLLYEGMPREPPASFREPDTFF